MWLFRFILIVLIIVNTNELVLNNVCQDFVLEPLTDWKSIFVGKWYEIHRYPIENDVQCIEMYFNQTSNTNYTLHFHGMENKKMVHEDVEIFTGDETFMTDSREFRVLEINPVSFAIIHECVYNSSTNEKTVNSWILSRDVYLKPSDIENVANLFNTLKSPELNLTAYESVVHWDETCSGCYINGALLYLVVFCIIFIKML